MSDWKMDRNEVQKLIAYYKRSKCLWDFKSKEYKHTELRRNAWRKLATLFDKNPQEIKLKVKYLRSAYASERKKVEEKRRENQKYVPRLFYFDSLRFLDSVIVSRPSTKFNNADPICDNGDEEETYEEVYQEPYEHFLESHEPEDEVEMVAPKSPSTPPPSTQPPPPRVLKSPQATPKERKLPPSCSKIDVNTVATDADSSKTSFDNSVYMAFGKTIALQLSQLKPLEATIAMSEIHEALSKSIIKSMMSKNTSYI